MSGRLTIERMDLRIAQRGEYWHFAGYTLLFVVTSVTYYSFVAQYLIFIAICYASLLNGALEGKSHTMSQLGMLSPYPVP